MSTRNDPAALRWLIGGEMAHLRERGGLSLAEVAAETSLTKAKLGHMEIGRTNQDADDLAEVLRVCDAPDSEIERLRSLASKPRGKPWWHRWKAVTPDWFGLYLGLEGIATSLFVYELAAVHGLLQTRQYAMEVTTQAALVDDADADRAVSLRMARAERLRTEPRLAFHIVLDEAALHRRLNDPAIMADQYQHLLSMGTESNITLQVLPIERGLHAGVSMGNYAILDFDGPRSVVYADLYGDASYIRDPSKVDAYRLAARHCSATALSPADSRDLIKQLRKDL